MLETKCTTDGEKTLTISPDLSVQSAVGVASTLL